MVAVISSESIQQECSLIYSFPLKIGSSAIYLHSLGESVGMIKVLDQKVMILLYKRHI